MAKTPQIESVDSGRFHVVPSCASVEGEEEEKNQPQFSVYEVDRSNVDRKTKETMNNTDDILEIEMIQLQQKSDKKQKNNRKDVEKGIKLIMRSLKKTERTMGTLLDIMMGAEVEKRDKNKRSSSVFS